MKISFYSTLLVALTTKFSGFGAQKTRPSCNKSPKWTIHHVYFVLNITRGKYVSFYFEKEIAFLVLLLKNSMMDVIRELPKA